MRLQTGEPTDKHRRTGTADANGETQETNQRGTTRERAEQPMPGQAGKRRTKVPETANKSAQEVRVHSRTHLHDVVDGFHGIVVGLREGLERPNERIHDVLWTIDHHLVLSLQEYHLCGSLHSTVAPGAIERLLLHVLALASARRSPDRLIVRNRQPGPQHLPHEV